MFGKRWIRSVWLGIEAQWRVTKLEPPSGTVRVDRALEPHDLPPSCLGGRLHSMRERTSNQALLLEGAV